MLLEFIVRRGRKEWGGCVVGQSENMFRKKRGEKSTYPEPVPYWGRGELVPVMPAEPTNTNQSSLSTTSSTASDLNLHRELGRTEFSGKAIQRDKTTSTKGSQRKKRLIPVIQTT